MRASTPRPCATSATFSAKWAGESAVDDTPRIVRDLQQQLNRAAGGLVIAVSGGPDSVALARAAVLARGAGPGRLVLAHVNHCLRGAESDADEALVVDLASR